MALKTVLNLDADTGANVIGNEATPLLDLSNSSTGPGLQVDNLVATSGATIASLSAAAAVLAGVTSLDVDGAILAANATVTAIDIRGASVASGAIMTLSADAAMSLATINSAEGGVAGTYGFRVALADGTFGWVPIYPDAAVTGDVVA